MMGSATIPALLSGGPLLLNLVTNGLFSCWTLLLALLLLRILPSAVVGILGLFLLQVL